MAQAIPGHTRIIGTDETRAGAQCRRKVLDIDSAKVEVKVPYLGGGFGRRYYSDFIVQAASLARETRGAPVQLIWSREQDMAHDYYRPAFVSRCQAGLDGQGKLVAWQATSAGSSMGAPSFIDNSTDGASNTASACRTRVSRTRPSTRR
jgi:isoquinoline 1-oxidoreductase beta subunit